MESPRGACLSGGVAVTVAALLLSSCGGGSSPSPAVPSPNPPTVPGATVVNGTERLAWSQAGEVSGLRFVAYVDGSPVSLDTATCSGAPSECTAPLPPLTTGVHTIALAAVSAYGLESPRSDALTVQKVATRSVIDAAAVPDAVAPGGAHLEFTVATSGGVTFAADVVARAMKAPMQLATTPDGRLLVADADGRVHMLRPGAADGPAPALDARALLSPPPSGPLGLALHPEFASNRFAYISFLAEDGPDRTLLRIVRLREAGETLGEPATLFEAPVVTARDASRAGDEAARGATAPLAEAGPRLSFGPDGLLYVLLPPGFEFLDEPAASRPRASMLRIADDGRVPEVGPLSGITAHPLGFAWHPSTAVLWAIFPAEDGGAEVRPITPGSSGGDDPGQAVLRLSVGPAASSGTLALHDAPVSGVGLPKGLATGLDYNAAGVIRLLVPILAESLLTGISGRIADVVAVGGGTVYVATIGAEPGSRAAGDDADVVLRLRLRQP